MIRRCKYSDLLEIAALEKSIFKSPWSYKMLAETFLTKSFVGFVYEKDKTIIGYGGFVHFDGEADITKIAVREDCRKMGIGSGILQAIIDSCKGFGVGKITLEVRVSNNFAKDLYLKFGFKKISVRPNYYGDEDAIVMQYIL